MSQKFRSHFADPKGIIAEIPPQVGIIAHGTTVPTDATSGYGTGCLFLHTDGSAGTAVYVNEGSATSCDFNALGTAASGLEGGIVINEAGANVNVRIETDTNANFFTIDGDSAGGGSLAIGAAVPTNPQALVAVLPPANASGVTASQSYFHAQVLPGGATVIPTGTAPVVASLNVHEPNITATGTVTAAATVRIVDAPTEGSANYALWVDAGSTRLDGNLEFSAAASVVGAANTAAELSITDGTTSLYVLDSRNTVTVQNHLWDSPAAQTLPNGATSRFRMGTFNAHTVTLAGTTQVTTTNQGATLFLGAPTYAQSGGAVTVDQVSTLHVAVPVAGSMVTITANRHISTGVADCYLTNGGVWTDTACWSDAKEDIERGSAASLVNRILDKLQPATWRYADTYQRAGYDGEGLPTTHTFTCNDRGRERVGIVYDDLPEELRAPGEERGVSAGLLSSFALAAIKTLSDRVKELEAKLA